MKTFLAALAAFAVLVAVTGFAFERINYTATEAYSADSARVGRENPVGGRLGWSPDV